MPRHRPRSRLALALALASLLTACGGVADDIASKFNPLPPGTPEPQLSTTPTLLQPGISIGTSYWPDGSTATGGHGAPVGNVNCLVSEDYHLHAHLTIMLNGSALAIPAHIGLDGCAYELHTHDQSGVVHVETATARQFTLGQLFAVWGQPLSRDNVAGITGQKISVYVNDGDNMAFYPGNPPDLQLLNHRAITIVIGTPPATIPSYTWGGGL